MWLTFDLPDYKINTKTLTSEGGQMAKKPKVAAVKAHEAKAPKADAKAQVGRPAAAPKPKAAAKPGAAKPKVAAKPAAAKPKVVAKPAAAKPAAAARTHNSHYESAQLMKQLAQLIAKDPEEAKVFGKKTGVYTNSGELTAAYR